MKPYRRFRRDFHDVHGMDLPPLQGSHPRIEAEIRVEVNNDATPPRMARPWWWWLSWGSLSVVLLVVVYLLALAFGSILAIAVALLWSLVTGGL